MRHRSLNRGESETWLSKNGGRKTLLSEKRGSETQLSKSEGAEHHTIKGARSVPPHSKKKRK